MESLRQHLRPGPGVSCQAQPHGRGAVARRIGEKNSTGAAEAAQKGSDLEYGLNIDFWQAIRGTQVRLSVTRQETCTVCNGSGVRAGANADDARILALGFLLLGAAGAAVACGAWRSRHLASGADPATPWPLVAATVAICWIASLAAVAAIVSTLG